MNCLPHQHIIMTPFFWWNFISLVILHLVVISQKVHLFDPLERNETTSSCPGTGLIAGVDRLFLLGTGTNLSEMNLWAPMMFLQQKIIGKRKWKVLCRIHLHNCTGDTDTVSKCGCNDRGNDSYDFYHNITVRLYMNQSLYRFTWIAPHTIIHSTESRKIPTVWRKEYYFVKTVQKSHVLERSGKCELPFLPNTPFSYCVSSIEKPFSVRIISWNKRQNNIVSNEIISQRCVNTSGFSESGGILAYTEFTGCQRHKTRYCSVIATAKDSPHACKEEEMRKGSIKLTVENHAIDLSEEICSFILREDVNVSMTVCIQVTQPPYNVTIVLGNHVKELTNFSQDCISLYHTPSAATFQSNYQFIFIDICQNNVTLICSAVLFAKEPSGRADNDEPSGRAWDDGKMNDSTSMEGGGNRYYPVVILSIIICVLLSIMCLTVACLPFLSKEWQETEEDAAIENDEGDATGREYFDDLESETTKLRELGDSFLGSEVDSATTLSSYESTLV